MARAKTVFVCNDCGGEHSKWQGQCAHCGAWNTMTQLSLPDEPRGGGLDKVELRAPAVERLEDIALDESPRIATEKPGLDRVLGGGMVPGSAVLIGGHPGAGKSTLLLQIACHLAARMETLYVSGEESPSQLAMRARRLGLPTEGLRLLADSDLQRVCQHVDALRPRLLVVDSIQVMRSDSINSAAGSVAQVRECASALIRIAKAYGTVLFLVGHVTKDGSLAGPKALEHIVDASLLLDVTDDSRFRMLRSLKNRFGAVDELAVFVMTDTGMKEVSNPSAIFLARADHGASGNVVTVLREGSHALLVELQALASPRQGEQITRLAVGLDVQRMRMSLAVLQRHGQVPLGGLDVFVNVVGGVRVTETAADLALVLAVASSWLDQMLPRDMVAFGEVGLNGEIRPVPDAEGRLREAAKHGFKRAVVPHANQPKQTPTGMAVIGVKSLSAALSATGLEVTEE